MYILDLIKNTKNIIAFADDIVIYHADKSIYNINNNLQEMFHKVELYTINWNLKINVKKCETILFRPPVDKCNYNIRKHWKKFGIKSITYNTRIPIKENVKYLGIYLDKFLYYNTHIKVMLEKARKAFFPFKKLFYSKYVKRRIKILMYQSLIRPILTYACQIWFNILCYKIEKIRVSERKCLSMYQDV